MYNIRGEIMQSMTGYGKAEYSTEKLYLSVELKAVNNRFLDLVPKTPRVFLCFEDLIRKTVASKVARGRVELFVTLIDNREKEKNIITIKTFLLIISILIKHGICFSQSSYS